MTAMIGRLFRGRVQFHDGTDELAPGITVHHVGGHTDGLQVMRVKTERGWVVLASDASHFYANFEQMRAYPTVYNVGDMLEGFADCPPPRQLAAACRAGPRPAGAAALSRSETGPGGDRRQARCRAARLTGRSSCA